MNNGLEVRLESAIDNLLHMFFGGSGPVINTIAGAAALIAGIMLLYWAKNQTNKKRNTLGGLCIGIGGVAFIGGVVQLLL